MFKISNYSEAGERILLTIQYQFLEKELVTVNFDCRTKQEARYKFGEMATEFLRGQIDMFRRIVMYIKPHYFDKTKVPYMQLAHNWRVAYYKFMLEFRDELNESYYRPGEYSNVVIRELKLLETLIPTMHQLGRSELKILFEDIEKTAQNIQETIRKN